MTGVLRVYYGCIRGVLGVWRQGARMLVLSRRVAICREGRMNIVSGVQLTPALTPLLSQAGTVAFGGKIKRLMR